MCRWSAIAKGPDRDAGLETFFMPGREPFKLPPRDPVLYFVQRLRDEAHRFAIGSHRTRRRRDIREAGLQEIPGIGPTRKRALLHHFGTLKAIERASLADLAKVPGINAETARKIYDFFHEGAGQRQAMVGDCGQPCLRPCPGARLARPVARPVPGAVTHGGWHAIAMRKRHSCGN